MAALSGLRERLEPQLKRLGVGLEWSMLRLPEISGVTPAHALNVLRIVHDAVTIALLHGPAAHIELPVNAGPRGVVHLTIHTDDLPLACVGHGGDGLLYSSQCLALLVGAIRRPHLSARPL